MGAKGNNFWEARGRHGRLPIFESPEQMWETACDYFQWSVDNPLQKQVFYQGELCDKPESLMRPFTKKGFCIFAGCIDQTFANYKKKDDFLGICEQIESIIYTQKFEGASVGLLNASIIARDLGLKDASEVDHSSTDGSMSKDISVTIVRPKKRDKDD